MLTLQRTVSPSEAAEPPAHNTGATAVTKGSQGGRAQHVVRCWFDPQQCAIGIVVKTSVELSGFHKLYQNK